jgi:hypothetical protein
MADKKRVTLDFDERGYDILEELRDSTGKTLAGVIRSAVALYALTNDEGKKKHKFAILDEDGKPIKEIVVT